MNLILKDSTKNSAFIILKPESTHSKVMSSNSKLVEWLDPLN